jgi:hypothetical protein
MNQARNITPATRARLFSLAHNRCAFPGCTVEFFGNDLDQRGLANICHIEDANPDLAAQDRYNPNMTDDERRSYNNLILLCPNHHKVTDNAKTYTVEVLKQMKQDHNEKMAVFCKESMPSKYSFALNDIISFIGKQLVEADFSTPTQAPSPALKIHYNQIVRYKPLIEEYSGYQGRLNKIYKAIEQDGSPTKTAVLKNMRGLYLLEKGKQKNADDILDAVKECLWAKIEAAPNSIPLPFEVIEMNLMVIIVDAFMRCEILEEPQQGDLK